GPDPRNFNQRVSLGRNDLLIRTFPNVLISVLVATDNIKSLKKAYPNYFGSTNQFTKFLDKHLRNEG
ncbi:hypothetical protein ML316_21705, partial [Escherichia coli]|nr:hypothetical protein [Escherichia coli]